MNGRILLHTNGIIPYSGLSAQVDSLTSTITLIWSKSGQLYLADNLPPNTPHRIGFIRPTLPIDVYSRIISTPTLADQPLLTPACPETGLRHFYLLRGCKTIWFDGQVYPVKWRRISYDYAKFLKLSWP